MDSSIKSNSFDYLKRKAASLSNEIDNKLVSFSRISVGSHRDSEDEQPLLSEEDQFANMKGELEVLLKHLTETVDQMSDLVEKKDDMIQERTLTRNIEILQSYTREFEKTESNFRARMERQHLLHLPDGESSESRLPNGRNRRLEFVLRENEHTRSSQRLVDEQIAIALETRDHLSGQRVVFKRMQTRLNDLANRFPMINSLVQRISSKQRRSAAIVGSVVGICTFLLLAYTFW